MDLAALIAKFRVDVDDGVVPYFFSDPEVTAWLNEAEEEAAARAKLLHEDTDPAICTIAVVAGTSVYQTHAAMLDITKAIYTPTDAEPIELCLTDRIELDRTVRDWRTSTDEPAWLIQDDTRIRMVPAPTQDGVLQLECYRLPLVPMAANDDTPEIARTHHAKLVHWAIYQGFMKPDSETIDPDRAAAGNAAFTAYFGIRTDADTSKAVQANRPHVNKCVW